MSRWRFAACGALLIGSLCPLVAPAQDDPAQAATAAVRPALALVTTYTADHKPVGGGSGFVVDASGWVITCVHVLQGAQEVKVRVTGQDEVTAVVAGIDEDYDLALLRLPSAVPQAVQGGGNDDLVEGAKVLLSGFASKGGGAMELDPSTVSGTIARVRPGRGWVTGHPMPFGHLDARPGDGLAGAPVYLVASGKVIGVSAGERMSPWVREVGTSIVIPTEAVVELWNGVADGSAPVPDLHEPFRMTRQGADLEHGPRTRHGGGGTVPGGRNKPALPGVLLPLEGWSMLTDPSRPRIYVSQAKRNSLAVVNTDTDGVEQVLNIGSAPGGLAISPDGATLYVAISGANQVAVVDLESLTPKAPIRLTCSPANLACPSADRLYVTSGSEDVYLLVRLPDAGGRGRRPGGGLYHNGLVLARPGTHQLVLGEAGLSPASWYSGDTDVEALKFARHGDIGSNLQDMRFSPDGRRLYICSGHPYYVQVFDADTLDPAGRLECGPYPSHVAVTPDSTKAFVVHNRDRIVVFDADTFLPLGALAVPGEVGVMAFSKDGAKLAAMSSAGLWLVPLADLTYQPMGK